jgi:ornithine cyclodeaminase/alanine dehydrogenase-like protein (mu-crystallin family)
MSPRDRSANLADIRALAGQMAAALRSGAVRRMIVPPRETAQDAAGTKFISMPAVSPDFDLYINKVATIVPPGAGPTVTSVVPVFSASRGSYLGTLDGALVTNLKCAAVTALVTDRCAAKGSEVRVFSPNHEHAAGFADFVGAASGGAAPVCVAVCGSAADASRDVDILVTATVSSDPLPVSRQLRGHVHVNCVGAHTVRSRELPLDLLTSSVLIVEDRPTAIAEAGPVHSTAFELDALDTPAAAGFDERRTVFSSTGCAYLDLITCAYLVTTVLLGSVNAFYRGRCSDVR